MVSLANDSVGYMPTDDVIQQGGLEAMRAAGEGLEAPILEHVRLALAGVAD